MSLVYDAFAKQNKKNPQNTQMKPKPPSEWGFHDAVAAVAALLDLLEKWLSEVLPGNVASGSFVAPFLLAALSPSVPLLFAGSDSGKVRTIH